MDLYATGRLLVGVSICRVMGGGGNNFELENVIFFFFIEVISMDGWMAIYNKSGCRLYAKKKECRYLHINF